MQRMIRRQPCQQYSTDWHNTINSDGEERLFHTKHLRVCTMFRKNSLAVEAQDPVYGYSDVSTVKHANCKNVNTDDNCDSVKCVMCGTSPHKLFRCQTFKGKRPEEMLNCVHLPKFCICCFSKGHGWIRCCTNVKCW